MKVHTYQEFTPIFVKACKICKHEGRVFAGLITYVTGPEKTGLIYTSNLT